MGIRGSNDVITYLVAVVILTTFLTLLAALA